MSFERQKEIQAKKRRQACFTSFDRYTERYVRTLKLTEVKIPHSRYLAPNGQPLLSARSKWTKYNLYSKSICKRKRAILANLEHCSIYNGITQRKT